MDARLTNPFRALQLALGLTAVLAGLDKYFNILADWGSYVSPLATDLLPVSVPAGTGGTRTTRRSRVGRVSTRLLQSAAVIEAT